MHTYKENPNIIQKKKFESGGEMLGHIVQKFFL